jgi:1-deoxy-D-xylulose-5-phosphate reductoisomerase
MDADHLPTQKDRPDANEGPRRVLVLGSTGSIGRQTLDVIAGHPGRFEIVGLVAGRSVAALAEQAAAWGVRRLGVADSGAAEDLRALAPRARVAAGIDAICGLVDDLQPDLVVGAVTGVAGLSPVLTALRAGIDVAIANKEPLVAAGHLVTAAAAQSGARLRPIDSEISAVFQCLEGRPPDHLARVLLTASGGAFRDCPPNELAQVTPQMALAHPTWSMGPKITVDCATLANKGFEVFELKWLFGLEFHQIQVVIHHQSIIHSLVELADGSLIAQLGPPDMRYAIQYALTWPQRWPNDFPRLNLAQVAKLTFAEPDFAKFPLLRLAFEAGEAGGSYPAVLAAADEAAVELFLAGRIPFTEIADLVAEALDAHQAVLLDGLADVEAVDRWARRHVLDRAARQSAT